MTDSLDTAPFWLEEVDDLLARASDVSAAPPVRRNQLTASEAAHALSGVMSWIQRAIGANPMREIAAKLARYDAAWTSSMGRLPHVGGVVDPHLAMMAVVARSLLDLAGADNLRSAVAFWATETDPCIWRSLAA